MNPTRWRCFLCGEPPRHAYRQLPGRIVCADHPWCPSCQEPHLRPCPDTFHRVTDLADARQRAATVRADLARVGIVIPDPPLFLDLGDTRYHGMTRTLGSGATAASTIHILPGLVPTRFGHACAHEYTHALIAQAAQVRAVGPAAEGICEMVGIVWLTTRPAPSPGWIRTVWTNPHPVYGGELRRAVAAARRYGVPAVLSTFLSTGRLPS